MSRFSARRDSTMGGGGEQGDGARPAGLPGMPPPGLAGASAGPEGLPESDLQDIDLGGAPKNLRMGQGTFVLLAAVVIAGGAIYAMRLTQRDLGGGSTAREVEARIEQALARLTNRQAMAPDDPLAKQNLDAMFKDTDAIVATFAINVTDRQVAPEFVKKNPFALTSSLPPPPAAAAGPSEEQKKEQERQQQLAREIKDLQLQTVMQGRMPVAVINGELLRVGQRIGSFTVQQIGAMSVTLECDGRTFTLNMQSPASPSPRKRG